MPTNSTHKDPSVEHGPISASERADKGIVRLNVNINAETAEALKALAEAKGISVTEAIRRAISVYKFVEDEVQIGRKVRTMDTSDNNVRELVLMG